MPHHPTKAEVFRKHAADARKIASRIKGDDQRLEVLEIAAQWERLARREEDKKLKG